MFFEKRLCKLILGGGGVKGIAYIGAFEAAENRGIRWGSIAGVSAGALAGALLAAGYSAKELRDILNTLDFEKIDMESIPDKVPLVARLMDLAQRNGKHVNFDAASFLKYDPGSLNNVGSIVSEAAQGDRGNILKKIAILCQEGCLFDGDYLEEWVAKALAAKGVVTFGDFRGGVADRVNPRGYKVRMTAVDINRAKVILLPDDIAFYGIDPDRFSVATAIRMSTCVPFAFKPVEIKKYEGNTSKTYYIVDGGILDGFPFWSVENSLRIPSVGFTLKGSEKSKLLSLGTPLSILKSIISAVHDIGVPKQALRTRYIASINTAKVGFLDFNLSEEEKKYLYNAGKKPANILFNRLEYDMYVLDVRNRMLPLFLAKPWRRL